MTAVLIIENFANDYARELLAAFPQLDIQTASSVADTSIDPSRVNVLVAFGMAVNEELFKRMPNLRWVQSLATGVDHFLRSRTLMPEVILTSGRGIHGPAMRETVLYLMLSVSRDSDRAMNDKIGRRWERRPWPLLARKTAVVIGTGVAGSAIGLLLQALGMHVVGVSRTPRDAEGFDVVVSQGELMRIASEADYLINVLPGDAANRNLIGSEVFASMKPRAYFVNVGRGETVDEVALIEVLKHRRIAGAGLDVFANEPLPPESALWDLPNAFITPHTGGLFHEYQQMAIPLIIGNMRAFLSGQIDQMTNVIERSNPSAKVF